MKKLVTLMAVFSASMLFVFMTWSGQAAAPENAVGGGGATVYNQHCVKCHGAGGKGVENFTPDLAKVASRGGWLNIIKEGKGSMPGFKDSLKPAQVSAVLTHIRSFGKGGKKS
ncbi:MAG: c-type cytochrome [Acidobacteria bacterium]|nr:c-type cytochrome [Acidobacteriota bacterium]